MLMVFDNNRLKYADVVIPFCLKTLAAGDKEFLLVVKKLMKKYPLVVPEAKNQKKGDQWLAGDRAVLSVALYPYLPSQCFNPPTSKRSFYALNKTGGYILETIAINLEPDRYLRDQEVAPLLRDHKDVVRALEKDALREIQREQFQGKPKSNEQLERLNVSTLSDDAIESVRILAQSVNDSELMAEVDAALEKMKENRFKSSVPDAPKASDALFNPAVIKRKEIINIEEQDLTWLDDVRNSAEFKSLLKEILQQPRVSEPFESDEDGAFNDSYLERDEEGEAEYAAMIYIVENRLRKRYPNLKDQSDYQMAAYELVDEWIRRLENDIELKLKPDEEESDPASSLVEGDDDDEGSDLNHDSISQVQRQRELALARLAQNYIHIPINKVDALYLDRAAGEKERFKFDYKSYINELRGQRLFSLDLFQSLGFDLRGVTLNAGRKDFDLADASSYFLMPGAYLIIGLAERGKTTLQRQITDFCKDRRIDFDAIGIGEVGEDFHTVRPATTIQDGVDMLQILLTKKDRKKVFLIDSIVFLLDEKEGRALSGGVNAAIYNFIAAMQVWAESQGVFLFFAINPGADPLVASYVSHGTGRSSGVIEPNRGESLKLSIRRVARYNNDKFLEEYRLTSSVLFPLDSSSSSNNTNIAF